MIDTLTLAERIEHEFGDDPERARHYARILGDMIEADRPATKQDVRDLDAELTALRRELAEMRAETSELRTEVPQAIAGMDREFGSLPWKITGLLIAQAAVIIALIEFLPRFQ